MKKLRLINFKLRNKLLLIYFFCVLIPIILTDVVILSIVNRNYEIEKDKETQYLLERIEMNLCETVQDSILFTNNLYLDWLLNDFLDTRFEDYTEYFDQYAKLLRYNNLSYNYNNSVLAKIVIYTDNKTILPGGKMADLKAAEYEEWMKQFKKSGKKTFFYVYYDTTKKYAFGSGSSRTLSVIRVLDNYGNKGVNKLLKIDIDYNILLKDILDEKSDDEIYVRNDQIRILSNQGENGMQPFLSASSIELGNNVRTKKFAVGGQEWEIIVNMEDIDFWTVILSSNGLITLVLTNILLPSILIYFVGKSISKRLAIVSTHLDGVKKEKFDEIKSLSGDDEIGDLIHSYNLMVQKIRNLIEVVFKDQTEKQALEISKKQAELKAIQSQVNPHFLFNTLESIRMRSLIKGEEETADIIGEMAVILRKSMNWGSDFVTVDEELSFIEKYIHIQRYRFGDKIKFNHYVMKDCGKYMIPKLAIGTFIENACIHGIESTAENGIISLNITKDKEYLFIEISDNGCGFESAKLLELKEKLPDVNSKMLNESKSTGMLNAFIRLKMYSEGEAVFDIDSVQDKGTDITIRLPLSRLSEVKTPSKEKIEGGKGNDQGDDC